MCQKRVGVRILLVLSTLLAADVHADRISDIRNTKHNFSATVIPGLPEGGARDVFAVNESQVCAFCHTPHAATQAPKAPIWNRRLSGQTYTPYTSTSMDAVDIGQPNTKSKLCLSCHDGTLAIGSVNVLNRQENPQVLMTGVRTDGTMPPGAGEGSGFTRLLGTDLSNDHPISFTYDSAQALRDGELRYPNQEHFLGERTPGTRPLLPLENNQMECVTCHDPHIRSTDGENIKFLRVNRFQQAAPVEGRFDQANDVICMACHEKAGWALSAHANPAVADEVYTDAAADIREFPRNTQVWQAACFNCHDPHTVQGSRRLLREGTDDPGQIHATGLRVKQGGKAAIEETCYACHSADGGVLQGQGSANFQVPDVKTDFTTMRIHMPIASEDQPAGMERHSIGTATQFPQNGQDFMESQLLLGKGDLSNRHAECTDCHNPHRVTQNRLFNADPNIPDGQGTHNHGGGSGDIAHNPSTVGADGDFIPAGVHNNLASGVLRGAWGVEPIYGSTEFVAQPVAFEVKRGDPGVGGGTDASEPYVTREYQVCMKCHSNYGYDTPPPLGTNHSGGTPPGTNSLFVYTNQGAEYQSPSDHKGEFNNSAPATPTGAYAGAVGECAEVNTGFLSKGADPVYTIPGNASRRAPPGYLDPQNNCVNYVTENHRSWHPVMKSTGRTPDVRGELNDLDPNDWLPPFNAGVGVQTMYCTDCHGSDTAAGTVVPRGGDRGMVWGPHGSDHNFLLKGDWSENTGEQTQDGLCFKCHDYNYYGKKFGLGPLGPGDTQVSGFSRQLGGAGACLSVPAVNLHTGHAKQGAVTNFRCNFCHIAIPHGWKNKNFLANLNDVGPEIPGVVSGGNQVRNKTVARYFRGPYYNGTVLKVVNFKRSGAWEHFSCGSAGTPGNGQVGGNGAQAWMTHIGAESESCQNIP